MKVTVQVVIEADGQVPTVVTDVFALERGALGPDTLGLRLEEANGLLSAVQETIVDQQVNATLAAQAGLPGLRGGSPPQGRPGHRGAQPVRDAAPAKSPLVALLLPAP